MDRSWTFIDNTGHILSNVALSHPPGRFREGLCSFTDRRGRRGYLNANGDVAIEPRYRVATDFSEGAAWVSNGTHSSFIDSKGRLLFDRHFDDCRSFSGGMAPVAVGDTWGYIGLDGEWLITPRFKGSISRSLSEGLCAVEVEGLFGFVERLVVCVTRFAHYAEPCGRV